VRRARYALVSLYAAAGNPGYVQLMEIDSSLVGRILLVVGVLIAVSGLVLALGGRLPFGRLPGDFSGSRGNVSFGIPLGTCLLLSVVLTVVINLLIRK
jgi:hypothetical protein